MKKLILIFILGLMSRAIAQDQWFCTDDQAKREGNALMICGVGTASTEGDARTKALINSVNEFQIMCNLSSDCKGRKFIVEPKRSTCLANPSKFHSEFQNFTCHRLLVFTIQ